MNEKRKLVFLTIAQWGFGVMIGLVLYFPWIGTLERQVADVQRGYWIPALTLSHFSTLVCHWGTGIPELSFVAQLAYLLVLSAIVTVVIVRGDRVTWFFLVQAVVPLLLAIVISVVGGANIVLARYLAFAQFNLLGLYAAFVMQIRHYVLRTASIAALFSVSLYGASTVVLPAPHGHGLETSAEYLSNSFRSGDLVLVSRPGEVNRLKYYLALRQSEAVEVFCRVSRTPRLHIPHLASLTGNTLAAEDDLPGGVERVWLVSDEYTPSSIGSMRWVRSVHCVPEDPVVISLYMP